MSDARDLSSLVQCLASVDTLILGESTRDIQCVNPILWCHSEILGWFDSLVVVIPLNHRLRGTLDLTEECGRVALIYMLVPHWFNEFWCLGSRWCCWFGLHLYLFVDGEASGTSGFTALIYYNTFICSNILRTNLMGEEKSRTHIIQCTC